MLAEMTVASPSGAETSRSKGTEGHETSSYPEPPKRGMALVSRTTSSLVGLASTGGPWALGSAAGHPNPVPEGEKGIPEKRD